MASSNRKTAGKSLNKDIFNKKTKKSVHFSFNMRMLINVILLLALLAVFIYSVSMSFSITKSEVITYGDKSNIDYKVYLKDNNFYDTPYLEKGMAYVASLIDEIKINYNYEFETSVVGNLDINYKVVAKLVIASQSNSSVFYEKEYDLTKPIIDEMVNKNKYVIDRDVTIDYGYYNQLANQFKSNYAVKTNSRLDVYLIVNEKNKEDNTYELSNTSTTTLTIPLSEQEININLDNQNINNENKIVKESKVAIVDENITYLIVSIVTLVLLFAVVTSLLKKVLLVTRKKKNSYDKYVNRILSGYDRIIVNVRTAPNTDDYNVIKVENFQELVDVRDNTKEPINYFVVIEHQNVNSLL